MAKTLLDTNTFSAYLSGDPSVLRSMEESDTIFMSTIVLGELYAGFHGGSQFKRNKDYLTAFLRKPPVSVLPVTEETSEIFGFVKNTLRTAGTPIPINDVWLSAHAFESGSVLVTYDGHFRKVPGIRLWEGMGS